MVCIFYKIGSEIGLNFTNISLNTKVGALIGTPEGVGENYGTCKFVYPCMGVISASGL